MSDPNWLDNKIVELYDKEEESEKTSKCCECGENCPDYIPEVAQK